MVISNYIQLVLIYVCTLVNNRSWNISRQLWWGQQIPAYFYGDGKEDFVVAESIEEALS
jgi:valyl-tRNA synthetase